MPLRILSIALIAGLALPGVLLAQSADTLSEAEIKERLMNQKTRSLVLAPVGAGQAAPAATDTTTTVAPVEDVVTNENRLFVNISFDFDSAALRADQRPKLTKLCNVIKDVDIDVFQIVGHTDSSGSAEYNERLSRLRAEEVKRYMVSECGIAAERLEASGMGESSPLNRENPRADENRRVEFQVAS